MLPISNALGKVEKLLDELDDELKKAGVDSDFKAKALKPLTDIKASIESQESIAHLQQLESRADSVFGQQVQAIADYLKSKQQPDKPDEPKLVIKPIVTVKTSSLSKKTYLETQTDVDEFVGQLKEKLSEEVSKNNRIRIE